MQAEIMGDFTGEFSLENFNKGLINTLITTITCTLIFYFIFIWQMQDMKTIIPTHQIFMVMFLVSFVATMMVNFQNVLALVYGQTNGLTYFILDFFMFLGYSTGFSLIRGDVIDFKTGLIIPLITAAIFYLARIAVNYYISNKNDNLQKQPQKQTQEQPKYSSKEYQYDRKYTI